MRLLRRNVLLTYGLYAASIASGLFVTPLLVHSLGLEVYGVWAFIGSLTTYLALLDLGLGPSVVRFAAENRGRRALEDTNALASIALAVYAAVAASALLLGLVLAWFVPQLVDVPESLVWPTRIATAIVVLAEAVRLPLSLFSNLLAAEQRYDLLNVSAIASLATYVVLVAAVVTQVDEIVALAAVAAATTVLRLGLPLVWIRRVLPELRLRRSLVRRPGIRRIFSTSADVMLIHIGGRTIFSADVIVVGIVLGSEAAGFYALPARLFALAFGLATAGTNLLYPAYAELQGAGDPQRQRILLRTALRVGMALMLLVALPLLCLPEQLLEGWIRRELDASVPVLALLAVVLILHQPLHVLSQYLVAVGRHRPVAQLSIGVAALNLVLSVLLARRIGIEGVALATIAADAVVLLVLPRLASTAAGIPVLGLARAFMRPLLPALAVAVPLLLVLPRELGVEGLLELLPIGIVWGAAGAAAIWFLGFSSDERAQLIRHLGRPRERPSLAVP